MAGEVVMPPPPLEQYTGLPSSEQWSRAPVLDQSGVEFFRGPIRRLVTLNPVGQNLGLVGRDVWDT